MTGNSQVRPQKRDQESQMSLPCPYGVTGNHPQAHELEHLLPSIWKHILET